MRCKVPACKKSTRARRTFCSTHARAADRAGQRLCHRCGAPLGWTRTPNRWNEPKALVCKVCVKKNPIELANCVKAYKILEKIYGH